MLTASSGSAFAQGDPCGKRKSEMSQTSALQFRKDDPNEDCEGLLLWAYKDVWGEVGWSIIDYYSRRKASYYWVRRATSPVKVLVRSRERELVTRIVNDTRRRYRATLRCGWMRLDGTAQELRLHSVTIPANSMLEPTRVPIASLTDRDPREWLYAATLAGEGFPDDQAIWLLAPHRELALNRQSTRPFETGCWR